MPTINLDDSDSSSLASSVGGLLMDLREFVNHPSVGIGHWEAARRAEEGYAQLGESPSGFGRENETIILIGNWITRCGRAIVRVSRAIVRVFDGLVTLAKDTYSFL
ncbi:hypothetical protein BZA05DRAFT_421392 [Tricharina praecox]|uniref:uncharacterized protein n=1 Tax=Tricharina praecox TaxID=43433 RepID=UPI0022200EB0|nr:uncharacterized protein BZA05DRAFT_421392 [Tricharina praecox]KAI5845312.1 hypothetical protein BZA05DRAFT_421392 [Tricharina praecox]